MVTKQNKGNVSTNCLISRGNKRKETKALLKLSHRARVRKVKLDVSIQIVWLNS